MTFLPKFLILLFFLAGFISTQSLAGPGTMLDQKFIGDSIKVSLDSALVEEEYIPNEPVELIQDRLSCVEQEIPLHYNKYVQGYVDYFTIRNRNYTRRVLGRETLYFPLFEKYLKQYELPDELKYLAVVESALLPRAVSRVKATGLWQFMPLTAKDFRLKQNAYIDERMDPEKSTEAACKYLRQLYRIFGDWEMVMAAYNYGQGNVKKAIRKSGKPEAGFWDIYPYLPAETRSYVPSFAAVIYAMKYAPYHNLYADSLQYPVATDTVLINHSLDLERFAAELNMEPDELLHLNPALKQMHLPEATRNYPLKVPADKYQMLALNRTAILDTSRLLLPGTSPARAPEAMLAGTNGIPVPPPADEGTRFATDSVQEASYVVQRGDNLIRIARAHNVSVEQLKTWNNLRKSTIFLNQQLTIYQPAPVPETTAIASTQKLTPTAGESTEPDATQSTVETASIVKTAAASPAAPKKDVAATKKQAKKKQRFHQVQPGDTLWDISRQYENLTVEQLKKINNLKTNRLKPGQKLVISVS